MGGQVQAICTGQYQAADTAIEREKGVRDVLDRAGAMLAQPVNAATYSWNLLNGKPVPNTSLSACRTPCELCTSW